jgi:hypothetical protein
MSEKMLRVLIVVSEGVADYMCDPGVEVRIFDWDNYKANPSDTYGVPEHFKDLVTGTDIPIGESLEERFPLSDWQYEVANGDTTRSYIEWAVAKAEESIHG